MLEEEVADFVNGLSPREFQVLRMIFRGLSNKEMARELGISPRTVEIYSSSILKKGRFKSRKEI